MQTFVGTDGLLDLPTVTFNLGSGQNTTLLVAHSYFDYMSSEPSVVNVTKEAGLAESLTSGQAVITASSAGVQAEGALTVSVIGDFNFAPTPTRDPNNVISIFSDVYNNVPVDFFNGYWQPYQTTESADFEINGDNVLNYTNFNFVGNQFANPTVDATEKSNMHINMFIPGEVPGDMDFLISLIDFGADGVEGGGDDTREQVFFNKSIWVANTWITLEFPITLTNKNAIGLIIYENINFSSLTNFYLDNIYFYSE